MEEIIARVRQSKTTGQKSITIPKENTEIKVGDYVRVEKVYKGGK